MRQRKRSAKRRQWLVGALLLVVVVLLVPVTGRAQSFGVHAIGGSGDHTHTQVGLTWDTAVAADRLFNYRMSLGYEWFKLDQDYGYTESFDGYVLDGIFGWRLLATDQLRLWAGPELMIALYEGDVGLSWGLALGSNFHLPGSTSLGVTLGVRRAEYSGMIQGSTDQEDIGYLRLDFFYRLPNDVF